MSKQDGVIVPSSATEGPPLTTGLIPARKRERLWEHLVTALPSYACRVISDNRHQSSSHFGNRTRAPQVYVVCEEIPLTARESALDISNYTGGRP